MRGSHRTRRKSSIFQIFLRPLIVIMLLQSAITIGTLVVRQTTRTLEEYSSSMMSRLVENRGVILQNDMNQRWASIHEQESAVSALLRQYLEEREAGLEEVLLSGEMRSEQIGRASCRERVLLIV